MGAECGPCPGVKADVLQDAGGHQGLSATQRSLNWAHCKFGVTSLLILCILFIEYEITA